MRLSLPFLAAVGLFGVAPAVHAQQPTEQVPEFRSVQVFESPKAPDPKDVVKAGTRIDPRFTAEVVTNSVVNAGGSWSGSLGGWTTGRNDIDKLIGDAGVRHGVDPKLIYSVMHQESRFKPRAVSHAGACGYMQLMPGTARRFGVTDIFDPAQNINAGTKYLRFLLDLFDNNVELALAGYNAGEYRVIRNGYKIPRIRETQHYVKTITAKYFGHGGTRRFAVTFGPPTISSQQRELIAQKARNEAVDRADDLVESVSSTGVPELRSY